MNPVILREIGLTDGETRVYLALIKLGSATSGPITDKSGVSRAKIYNILERLMQKGLVSYIIKEKTRYYQAEDPINIKDYLKKKESEFKKQKEEIDKIIPELQIQRLSGSKPSEAQIYKGFKGIQTVHEHMYQKLKRGDWFFYLGIPSYQKKEHHLYWQRDHKRREKARIISKALFNVGTPKKVIENRNSYKHSEARYMPVPVNTPAWFLGYKDVVVIGLQTDEGLAIEIVNQKIADSFREYFEAFWKLAEPFK